MAVYVRREVSWVLSVLMPGTLRTPDNSTGDHLLGVTCHASIKDCLSGSSYAPIKTDVRRVYSLSGLAQSQSVPSYS